MDYVKGRYPLSTNSGSVKAWMQADGVPRPDRSLSTTRWLSLLGGLFGLDHFYLRSPITGLVKLLTFGCVGVWWLWDVVQLWAEKDRVLSYGLTAPFDVLQGIGQGMITEGETNYSQKTNYSTWIIGVLFGFIGLDSFISQNMGQMLRKLVEFGIFASNLVSLLTTEFGFHTFINLALAWMFFGIIIIQWWLTLSQAMGAPERVFTKGIQFTKKEDQAVNGVFRWLINANGYLEDERKQQIIEDLQYGGVPPDKLRDMFSIKHVSEQQAEPEEPTTDSQKPGSVSSFLIMMGSPFMIFWKFIVDTCYAIMTAVGTAVNPTGKVVATLLGTLTKNPVAGEAAAKKLISKVPFVGEAVEAALDAENPLTAAREAAKNPLSAIQGAIANPLSEIKRQAAKVTPQTGGARESVSMEGKVLGAAALALIVGGAIKGLVDWTVQ